MAQLPLLFSLPVQETFASFHTENNEHLISMVQSCLQAANSAFLYIWSHHGAGRSHLLHAACHALSDKGEAVAYIPLVEYVTFSPSLLEGLEELTLVCLDNIEAIAGKSDWELAIFNLYNRIKERDKTCLLITGKSTPKTLNIRLPDLVSRLEWGQVYRLNPLSDKGKLHALRLRAALRGFELPDEVGQFLLNRLSRDMRTLFNALDTLDIASLTEQRKVTIPFVKSILQL